MSSRHEDDNAIIRHGGAILAREFGTKTVKHRLRSLWGARKSGPEVLFGIALATGFAGFIFSVITQDIVWAFLHATLFMINLHLFTKAQEHYEQTTR